MKINDVVYIVVLTFLGLQVFYLTLNIWNTYKSSDESFVDVCRVNNEFQEDWTKLIRLLEILRYRNETLYVNVLQYAFKKSGRSVSPSGKEFELKLEKHIVSGGEFPWFQIDVEDLKEFSLVPISRYPDMIEDDGEISERRLLFRFFDKQNKKPSFFMKKKRHKKYRKIPESRKSNPDTDIPLPTCVNRKSEFYGREEISTDIYGYSYLEDLFNDTADGGHWKPHDCNATKRIAIIIPYRDRELSLKILLNNLLPKLRRQKVEFTVYVIEQSRNNRFNRGMMKNIGFMEARKDADYDCYVFNDADIVIEDDRNMYTCVEGAALHLAARVSTFKYKLPYHKILGGIVSFTEDLFTKANGYSNFFFVWGGEDDDLSRRVTKSAKAQIVRPDVNVTFTTAIEHERDPELPERYEKFHAVKYFTTKDGLNTLKYDRILTEKRKLYTWVYVDVNETFYNEMYSEYIAEVEKLPPKKTMWGTKKSVLSTKQTIFVRD